jgi:hypothetical protein
MLFSQSTGKHSQLKVTKQKIWIRILKSLKIRASSLL